MEAKAGGCAPLKMRTQDLSIFYGAFQAIHSITLTIRSNQVTALIGPSGCGKSTFLRALNRMNDLIPGARQEGQAFLDEEDIYGSPIDVVALRQQVGMVFQRANPFPMSITDNILFGPRVLRIPRNQFGDIVERSLRSAALWDEVKDRLKQSALGLSGGEQQRLCIARVLAVEPEVILMDEPCSALDPLATLKIEELMWRLKQQYTIVIVTHNMQQAARTSDTTGFFLQGKLIEYGPTALLFSRPTEQRTEDYITGRFG